MRRSLLLVLLLACRPAGPDRNLGDPRGDWRDQDLGTEATLGLAFDMPEAGDGGFSVLAANVGNIDLFRCDTAAFKLCAKDQEDRIAAALRRARPDVALLSELITPEQCDALASTVEPWHVCHPTNRSVEPDQVRRLLGDEYTIACEPRRGFECIAVRQSFAELLGCPPGGLCRGRLRGAAPVPGCDEGFTVGAITATIDGAQVDLVVAHPPSGLTAANIECRRATLESLLAPPRSAGALRENALAIVGGDFNLDPYRRPMDADVRLLRERSRFSLTSDGGPLVFHSGLPENDPPLWTTPLTKSTWDHLLSEGFIGRCVTLGARKAFPPLDEAKGSDVERLDHLAPYCVLSRAP